MKRMNDKKGKRRAVSLALSLLIGTGVFTAVPAATPVAHAANVTLYRITTDSAHTAQQLENNGIDIWEAQPNFVEAPLASDQITWLQANGWSYKMSRQSNGPSFDSSYRTYDQVRAVLADRASKYRDLAKVYTIGTSYEGQPIQVIKITNYKNTAGKTKSLWIGGTHAREISPPEVMLSNMDYLLTNYGVDPDVTWMLDNREIYILPVMNVDGHRKAESLLNWRKNTDTRWGGEGVDLNRNYDEAVAGIWGNEAYGTSTNPFSAIYCGPAAFSEPETTAVKGLIEGVMGAKGTPSSVANGFNMLVDMHSYGNTVMWPWNWTFDVNQMDASADIASMEAIGRKFATYNTYKPQIGSRLYYTTGDTTDWAYGFHRIPSFTIEIGKTFWPSNSELAQQITENRAPFVYGVKIQDDPYGRVAGPDATELAASVQGGKIVVTGSGDDTRNGSGKIKAVEVFVDKLGARGTGQAGVLGSATNSGAITSFSATLPANGLSSGKHLLIVETQDDSGAWGAPSAVWVTLP